MKTESLTDKLKGKKLSLIQIEGGYKLTEMTNIAKQLVFIPEDDLHYTSTKTYGNKAAFTNDDIVYHLVYTKGEYWKLERTSSTWAQY
mgnify:CR=1 FL=1